MHKKIGFLIPILLFSFVNFYPLGRIHYIEPAFSGEEMGMYVNVRNNLDEDFKGTSVRAFIYDLGIALYSNPFKLEDNSNMLVRLYWDVPYNIPPGDYLTKVSLSNDQFTSSQHIIISVR